MSQYQDPFPMASEEGQNLQAFVDEGSNLAGWNSMNTESHNKVLTKETGLDLQDSHCGGGGRIRRCRSGR
jgi:hypothetical protein